MRYTLMSVSDDEESPLDNRVVRTFLAGLGKPAMLAVCDDPDTHFIVSRAKGEEQHVGITVLYLAILGAEELGLITVEPMDPTDKRIVLHIVE